jgi:hypothetical protein
METICRKKQELEEIKNGIARIDRNSTTHIVINYQNWNELITELEKHIND